ENLGKGVEGPVVRIVLLIALRDVEQRDVATEARRRVGNPPAAIEDLGNRILIGIHRSDWGWVSCERDHREGDQTDGQSALMAKRPVHGALHGRSAHLVLSTGRRFRQVPKGIPAGREGLMTRSAFGGSMVGDERVDELRRRKTLAKEGG